MSGSFKSLLSDSACRREVLSSIGDKLRDRYTEQSNEAMPERLQQLVERLAVSERHGG